MAALCPTHSRSLPLKAQELNRQENSDDHVGGPLHNGQQDQRTVDARSSNSKLTPLLKGSKDAVRGKENTETRFTLPNTETRFTLPNTERRFTVPNKAPAAKSISSSSDDDQRLKQFLEQYKNLSPSMPLSILKFATSSKKAVAPIDHFGPKNRDFKRPKTSGRDIGLFKKVIYFHNIAYEAMIERNRYMTPEEQGAEMKRFNEEWAPVLGEHVFKKRELKLPSDFK